VTNQFLSDDAWKSITRTVRREPARCDIAIAYFADSGASLLPLKSGSLLVVDASDASVKAGRTCPSELRKLMAEGVRIHTVANLHAKVLVTPSIVFVGSTNVSRNSRDHLLEAVISCSDKRLIAGCRAWVRSLSGVELGPGEIERLESIYRPPKFAPPEGRRKTPGGGIAPRQQKRTWLAKTETRSYDRDESSTQRKGLPQARAQISDRKRFEVDDFVFHGGLNGLKRGDIVVVVEETSRGEYVSPPGRVLAVAPCRDRSRRVIFFERPKSLRRRSVKRVRQLLRPRYRRLFDRIIGSRVGSAWAHDLVRAAGGAIENT